MAVGDVTSGQAKGSFKLSKCTACKKVCLRTREDGNKRGNGDQSKQQDQYTTCRLLHQAHFSVSKSLQRLQDIRTVSGPLQMSDSQDP